MATRPKTPNAAWLIRHRKARSWKPEDVASRLDVSPDTVRGWEANRAIGRENRDALERLFGELAPDQAEPTELAALIRSVDALVDEMREDRMRGQDAAAAMLRAAQALLAARRPATDGESRGLDAPPGSAE